MTTEEKIDFIYTLLLGGQRIVLGGGREDWVIIKVGLGKVIENVVGNKDLSVGTIVYNGHTFGRLHKDGYWTWEVSLDALLAKEEL